MIPTREFEVGLIEQPLPEINKVYNMVLQEESQRMPAYMQCNNKPS